MTDGPNPFQRQLQRNAAETNRLVAGIISAGVPVGLTMLAVVPILRVFGEGDYILAVMAILFGGLFFIGIKVRKTSEVGSIRRSFGLWIAIYSLFVAALTSVLAVAYLFEPGGWRYFG